MLYEVIVTNDILGNSIHIMPMDQIKAFNQCAYLCARKVEAGASLATMGMWTVRKAEGKEGV